ncbi:MAG: SMC-Scp complex subunit ScpB [Clostridia bacterium]|nr:SMC-Scp complex subunit ScpB [Clostridia bacterium]
MTKSETCAAIEAILFAAGTSVEAERIAAALELDTAAVNDAANELISLYEKEGRGVRIIRLNKSYQMCSDKQYGAVVRKVMDMKKNTPLSGAAMEVLAVIAYNQPVTKGFVEQIRGVDCSGVIGSLCVKGLIEEKGRLELPGRPLLYGTTEHFLRCFGIENIEGLPPIEQKKNDETEEE